MTMVIAAAVRSAHSDALAHDSFWSALDADERLGALGWSIDESRCGAGVLTWAHAARPGEIRWSISAPEVYTLERAPDQAARGSLTDILLVLVHDGD